jgi:hypothetical protein
LGPSGRCERPEAERPAVEPPDREVVVVETVPATLMVTVLPAALEDVLDPPPHDASPSASSNRTPADRRSRKSISRSLRRA